MNMPVGWREGGGEAIQIQVGLKGLLHYPFYSQGQRQRSARAMRKSYRPQRLRLRLVYTWQMQAHTPLAAAQVAECCNAR